jgi:peptidoglycan/LPS O-acetylase OafA/YrhL
MRSIQFRTDINALRALAVAAVVLFHFKVNVFPGGFVGVDVFFVISGYLMTSIITRRLDKGSFSLIGFYRDRARRIVPPLIGLIFSLLVFGYFFLDPYTYERLASSSLSALLFYSNYVFQQQATGYFNPLSYTKWLLHTWSLSVEWQFYILYPVIVWGLYKFVKSRRWLLTALWVLMFASLAASIGCSLSFPTWTFYFLPFRGWELLAGGIVALQFDHVTYPNQKTAYAVLAAGFALIFIAIFTFNEGTPWPYFWALFPVVGTCLVISVRQTDLRAFTNPVCSAIGLWSYSTYLWHWPLAVGSYYFGYVKTTPLKVACLIIILTAFMSAGAFIVTSVQKMWDNRTAAIPSAKSWQLPAGISAFAMSALFAWFISGHEGLPNREPTGLHDVAVYTTAKNDFKYPGACDGLDGDGKLRPCRVGENIGGKGVLFIGDSQAMQILPHFTEALAEKYKTSFTFFTAHGCAPIPGVGQTFASELPCGEFMTKAFQAADTGDYSRIVIVSRWSYMRDLPHLDKTFADFAARLAEFKKRGIAVVIVSSTPVPDDDVPLQLLQRRFFGRPTTDVEYEDRSRFEKEIAPMLPRLKALAQASGATFIDPFDYLCDANRCPTVDEERNSLFYDQSHYRAEVMQTARFKFLDAVAGLKETAQADN